MNNNEKTLSDFIKYCKQHPEQRFWQALRNWVGVGFIFTSSVILPYDNQLQDTFYWKGKNK
jgi:hypothetical protein